MAAAADVLELEPISRLAERFGENCKALAGRLPELAGALARHQPREKYFLRERDGDFAIAVQRTKAQAAGAGDTEVATIANPVPRLRAMEIIGKAFPKGQCGEPLLVAGLDWGWVWAACYQITGGGKVTGWPRVPLFLVAREIESLWLAMHLHDWKEMLADPRAEIFVGADGIGRVADRLLKSARLAPPKICLTLDPALWPAELADRELAKRVNAVLQGRLNDACAACEKIYGPAYLPELIARLDRGESIRVLGITTRFSTFLQFSMRDWLAGWRALGHQVHLLIEQADHEVLSNAHIVETCAEFKPDLILIIDHYRKEMSGLPAGPLAAMWIQDRLPNIFSKVAGAAQGRWDYVLGYGKQECTESFDYPASRFVPARIGVNVRRFTPALAARAELDQFACDVSFVSHASATAEALVQQWLAETGDPSVKKIVEETFARLRAVYEAGNAVTEVSWLRDILLDVLKETGIGMSEDAIYQFQFRFFNFINNALFRHQSLLWLADMDIDLRLYGKGWETHPRLKRFAKGPADNRLQLKAIYQATRINLQVTPFGALHQRLCDGVAAGGFFLLRHCAGDEILGIYHPLWQWLEKNGIQNDVDFLQKLPLELKPQIAKIEQFFGEKVDPAKNKLVKHIRGLAGDGMLECPVATWPHYDDVTFRSQEQLRTKMGHFLAHPEDRVRVALAMRQPVVDCLSYEAISRRLLDFMHQDLRRE